MKVFIVTYYFPKLTETFILDRITKLLDKGIDITIIAISNTEGKTFYEDSKPESIKHKEIDKYELDKRTVYLNSTDPKNFENEMISRKPDIIHFQWAFLAEELLNGTEIDIPILVNYHETQLPNTWKHAKDILQYRNVIKHASLLLPTSNYIKNWLLQLGCPEQKLLLHFTGTDTNKFKPFDSDGSKVRKQNRVNIVTNGSFIEKKGHEYSLHALKILTEQNVTNFEFLIIGSGRLEPIYKKLIEEYSLKDQITFLGRLDKDNVVATYQNSDIFLLPSVTGYDNSEEGLPVAMIEAASCGLPIVATMHTGSPDLVKQGMNGFLASERNPFALAEYLNKLISDQNLRQNMGKEGRNIVKELFDLDKLVNDSIALYTRLLKK
jgi:colanic acid/amylovoran biosynthesis glycosyltransferase